MGSNMFIKIFFSYTHLEYIPENSEDFTDKFGERFQLEIVNMQKKWIGRWIAVMLADYSRRTRTFVYEGN